MIAKRTGLAALLALLLTAICVPSASAAFQSESTNTTWSVSGSNSHVFTLGQDKSTCGTSGFSAASTSATTEVLTGSPSFSNCNIVSGKGVSWQINGCKFRLRLTGALPQAGNLSIVNCQSPMTLSGTSGGQTCTLSIGDQGGRASISYSSSGSGSNRTVSASINVTGLTYTRSGSWCQGPAGTYNNGTYEGVWTLSGKNTGSGSKTGVWVEGNGSTPTPRFWAEEEPATIGGHQLATQTFSLAGHTLNCKEVTYSGTSVAGGGEGEGYLFVQPSYSKCDFHAVNTTLSMGGCSYGLLADGTLAIGGEKCASEPMKVVATFIGLKCTVTIGPQVVGSVGYANDGASVVASPAVSGIDYTATGTLCQESGNLSNGTLTGASVLTAKDGSGQAQALWVE